MSIENVTSHKITFDFSAEQVLEWFKQSRFSKHAEKFEELNGEDVLGLSKEDMEYMGLPRTIIPAVWNALHPYDDVEVMRNLLIEVEQVWDEMELSLPIIKENIENHLDSMESYFETFPQLFSLPKFYQKGGDILVREEYLKIYKRLRYYDKENEKGNRNYGTYLYGPNGIGKSMCLYSIACFAYSQGWLVVYVPDCDRWCSYRDEIDMYDHILKAMLFGFYQHREVFPESYQQIVQGIKSSDLRTKVSIYESVLGFLESITSKSVILIFDETNALFEPQNRLERNTEWFPYQHPLFKATASTLNILDMNRGLKLLSGTGHSEGLKHLAKGCEHFTHCLSLPSEEELKEMILHSSLFPDVPRKNIVGLSGINAEDQTNFNRKPFFRVLKMIISIIGSIPREVRSFGKYIDENDGERKYEVRLWLEMIRDFANDSWYAVFEVLVRYYNRLDDKESKKDFVRNLNLVFFGNSMLISLSFVDLSYIYRPYPSGPYRAVNQITTRAIAQFLMVYEAHNFDLELVLNPSLSNTEISLAFERLIMGNLYGFQKLFTTCDIYGKASETIDLGWVQKFNFNSLEELLNINIMEDSLLIPPESFPMLDFIVVKTSCDPPMVYICQVTLQEHFVKLPKMNNKNGKLTPTSYRGVFEPEFMISHYSFHEKHLNVSESLIALLSRSITTLSSSTPQFRYVILSGNTNFSDSPDNYSDMTDEMKDLTLIIFGHGMRDMVSDGAILKINQ